jgi:hypothetical protein
MIIKNSKQMIKTYQNIYSSRYDLQNSEIDHFENNLNKNLKEMKLYKKNYKNLSVLNTGTGLESWVFHKKGFGKIYLVDINNEGVRNINYLNKKNLKFKNIIAKKIDIVRNPIRINKKRIKVDLAYYQGVTHHFYNPAKGIVNIINSIKKDGIFFMRNYASGSLNFFTVDMVRKFIKHEDIKYFNFLFLKIIKQLIKKNISKISNSDLNQSIKYFKTFCGDHLFVPNLFLFDANKMNKFLNSNGLKKIFKINTKKYFFNCSNLGNSNISFIYKKIKENNSSKRIVLKHIDQVRDIKYKEAYIKNFIHFFKKNLFLIKRFSKEKKIQLAINLLFYADFRRYFLNYPKHKLKFKNINIKRGSVIVFKNFESEINYFIKKHA